MSNALSDKNVAILNGDRAYPSPLGNIADEVQLGTRLNELVTVAADLDTAEATLAGLQTTAGAGQIGITDAANAYPALVVTVEEAVEHLAAPIGLAAAAEAADVIDVSVDGVAAAAQYKATLYTAAMVPAEATAFTLAETGDGAEVSTTAQASLLFTTSASGAATLSVTDVVGASGATVYLVVEPLPAPAGVRGSASAVVPLTFD